MEDIIPEFIEWGVLGLWTLSLLWRERQTETRHRLQIEKMEERHTTQAKDLLDMRDKIQTNVLEELQENGHKIDMALVKINSGLQSLHECIAKHDETSSVKKRTPPNLLYDDMS